MTDLLVDDDEEDDRRRKTVEGQISKSRCCEYDLTQMHKDLWRSGAVKQ